MSSNQASNPSTDTIVERPAPPALQLLTRFIRSPFGLIGGVTLLLIVLIAIFAPLIAPQNPYDLMQLSILDGRLPPGSTSTDGRVYWLGTDDQGRDILSGIIFGLRTSLIVGIGSAVVAAVIGTIVGLLAGFVGDRTESVIMRIVDLQLSFPTILTALMILAALGKGVTNVMLALIIVEWATYARVARSAALSQRNREYVEAARSLAIPAWRILWRHILPNCIPPLLVIATIQVAGAISLEATLSFLGLGVPVTEPSLGLLIANGFKYMLSGEYWVTVYPGLALFVVIVALNLFGDRLREVLNPRGEA